MRTPKIMDSSTENFVNVMTENALMMKLETFVEATGSVTVETVTARLVGMAINVNSSVTSAHGRLRKDVHLQMAKSAATEERVYVANAPAMMWTQQVTGEIFMVTPVSVMKGTVNLCMTGTLMTSAQVMGNVTVGDVIAKKDGLEGNVNTHGPVLCR